METKAQPASSALYPVSDSPSVGHCSVDQTDLSFSIVVPREVLLTVLCDIPGCLRVSKVKFYQKKRGRLIFIDLPFKGIFQWKGKRQS